MESLKQVISGLEKRLESLKEIIEQREAYVYDRSEKWQESEKCEEYEDKTLEIDEKSGELETLIDDLKELL